MKKKIRVTEDDILRGKKDDCRACPVALALRRLFPTAEVYNNEVAVQEREWRDLPDKVMLFIEEFDGGRPVLPFTFTIDLPAPEPKSGP